MKIKSEISLYLGADETVAAWAQKAGIYDCVSMDQSMMGGFSLIALAGRTMAPADHLIRPCSAPIRIRIENRPSRGKIDPQFANGSLIDSNSLCATCEAGAASAANAF